MKRKYLIVISLFIFFIFLGLYLLDSVKGIDDLIYNFIINIKSDFMTNIMKFITFFGSTKFIVFLMVIFFFLGFKKKVFNVINLIIIGEVILNNLVKIIVKRDRPDLISLVHETSFSFPSGHTMVSVTLYGFIIYLLMNSKMSKKIKCLFISIFVLLINLIVISRIYLGAHYFSDCMAGIFLAGAYIIYCIDLIERKKLL